MILGLGVIGIGREWGHTDAVVPDEPAAMRTLECAVRVGYRYFDTAPSYGLSEERLGGFLRASGSDGLTIATKFGEHWDAANRQVFTDHSYDALRRSLDTSLRLLGKIDVLQLHKTTPEVLQSDDLQRAWEYARSLGIRETGTSVSNLASADLTIADERNIVIQAPFHLGDTRFGDALRRASARGMRVVVNRPLGMGALLYKTHPPTVQEAFAFILQQGFRGVILTGSKRPEHVEDNMRAFHAISSA